MRIYSEFLKIKNDFNSLDNMVDEVIDLCESAEASWTRLFSLTDIESDRASVMDTMYQNAARAAGKDLHDLTAALTVLNTRCFNICRWVINNIVPPPADTAVSHLSVVPDQGEEFHIYDMPVDNINSFIFERLNKHFDIYSVGEAFYAAMQTVEYCKRVNAAMFGPAAFNSKLEQIEILRKFCVDVTVNVQVLCSLAGLVARDPMTMDEDATKWIEYHRREQYTTAVLLFSKLKNYARNVKLMIEAIESNVAIYSAAVDAVEDDKFTM